MSAYVLTADKGAPRLTLTTDLDTSEFREELVNPKQPGIITERGAIFVKHAAIAGLIPVFLQDIGKQDLDQTGLPGQYSFFIALYRAKRAVAIPVAFRSTGII